VSSIREAVLARDPDVPLAEVSMMTDILSDSISETLILSVATALFAITALLHSLTGLYAVLAFYVARRTQEIGIRVALGATSGTVLKMVLSRGLVLVGGGLVLGLGGALASTRLLQNQLYQVGATDPWTFLGVAAGFLMVGLMACLVPGRRAAGVDPVRAMQVE
jgi:ABC-type antimicrobial peptide transport system permease subunit